jgi:protein tyrosine/serine phosphatase
MLILMVWFVSPTLARSSRPGYPSHRVPREDVEAWVQKIKAAGIKSIICLLSDELDYYNQALGDKGGLLEFYRRQGFEVVSIPVTDIQFPPMSNEALARVEAAFRSVSKPVLIHCSAGIDRTGASVEHLQRRDLVAAG